MAKDPPERSAGQPKGQDSPPPFQPDPRLVTFREGGRKEDAERWFRKALEKSARKEQRS
jgi:hypothetical protein